MKAVGTTTWNKHQTALSPPAGRSETLEKGNENSFGLKDVTSVIERAFKRVPSFLAISTTAMLFRVLLGALNKVECHNHEGLLSAVLDRGPQGLLTVSNHVSVYDDPGLWAALIPFWRTGVKKMRWSMCTDDIYFANKRLSKIFKAGKTLPIKRRLGMEQPYLCDFFKKLEAGDWGHIFAEGAIRQPWRFAKGEPLLGDFKCGIGRILLRSKNPPMVLPMFHIGMHRVAPETPVPKGSRGKLVNMLPKIGQTIHVYVGEPIDVGPIISKWKDKLGNLEDSPWTERSSKAEISCHKEIAAFIREHVLKLEMVARREYYGREIDSPYNELP